MAKRSDEARPKTQPREERDERVLQQLGNRIRLLRVQRGLTQEKLAERAGLTPKFLGEVERVETNPSATSLVRIAEGLAVDIGDLFNATTDAIPVSAEALAQLHTTYQSMGELLNGLTRLGLSGAPDEPGTDGARARHSRKE